MTRQNKLFRYSFLISMMGVLLYPAMHVSTASAFDSILAALVQAQQPAGALQVAVPYVSQIPDNRWVNPWSNACEEASVMMLAYYYSGITDPTKAENKLNMQALFTWQDGVFGYNHDTGAQETADFINATAPFIARVVENPTVDAIKAQVESGRPVIAMVHQYKLYNAKAKKGSSYHVVTIVGYDDTKERFLIYDPATPTKTKGTELSYSRVMSALSDYNRAEDEATGTSKVLFTDVR